MRSGLLAAAALLALATGCAPPPSHPVRTEAEAIALAQAVLGKAELDAAPLTARRVGETWLVTTPRVYTGSDWEQIMVQVDSHTGKTLMGSYQTATINEDLSRPN